LRIQDITALGRPIDPSYPTNRAIAILTLVVAVAGTAWRLLSGGALLESVLWGIGGGFGLFLTWALGRELDPDNDLSAFVGAGLALIALLLFDMPSFLMVLWLLLVLRSLNRTCGSPARPLDSLGILSLGAWLTWQGYWVLGLVTVVAFLLDGLLSPPLRTQLYAAGLALAVTVILFILNGTTAVESGLAGPVLISTALIAVLFLLVIATSGETQTVGDSAAGTVGAPLNPRRVQAAQILALATALLAAWLAGLSGMVDLLPLWAAMAGVGLYRLASLFLQRRR